MKARTYTHLSLLLALPLLWPGLMPGAAAKTVYQYIDKDGAMAFSDTRPEHTNDFLTIEVPDPPAAESPPAKSAESESAIEEMVEVTERLEASRRAREEARRQAAEQERTTAAPPPEYEADDAAYPYGYYPGYGPGYYPPHPRHPKSTPPYRVREPANALERRQEELKTPIRIPGFGTGEPLHRRLEPFDPPPRPPHRH